MQIAREEVKRRLYEDAGWDYTPPPPPVPPGYHRFALVDDWFGDGKDGEGAKIVAHLLLMAAHRARLLGYGREDLVRLLDATGIE